MRTATFAIFVPLLALATACAPDGNTAITSADQIDNALQNLDKEPRGPLELRDLPDFTELAMWM
jgi:hypothetical protein